ncbi:MAG TPA: Rieske 2Fe-2S domain-containing protein [Gaiellaceae bacterium]|jgi:nitrite reductase/ring-hydroxylating ferredoxin subunit/uncharacterized membrane protein|nr:Rieske 2Fe-2S domain-containing protein [Gaiellaceae bacterium]
MTAEALQRATERLASRLENAEGIDAIAERVHGVVTRLTRASPRVRDALSGTGLSHPAHPALVAGPLGCFTGALIADLSGERAAARRLTGAGVLLAAPAAATGLSDWTDTTGAERRIGFFHLAANVTTVAWYTASWSARRRQRHSLGIALGLAGALTATVGGWLGGHLTYAMGVGVDTTAFDGGPTEWTPLTRDKGNPLAGWVGDVPLVIVERSGSIHVLAGRCTHRGGPLSEGTVEADCIVCPWHGSRFSFLDGSVRSGPAVAPQPCYEVRQTDDGLEVRRREARSLRVNPARAPST